MTNYNLNGSYIFLNKYIRPIMEYAGPDPDPEPWEDDIFTDIDDDIDIDAETDIVDF